MRRGRKPIVPLWQPDPGSPKPQGALLSNGGDNPFYCGKSPSELHGHSYHLSRGEEGDGPCIHCKKTLSQVHKEAFELGLIKGPLLSNSRKGGDKRMAKTEEQKNGKIGVKELAVMAGTEPRLLRRLLRKSFGGGDRKRYTWDPKKDADQIQKIVAAVKASKEPKPEPKAETKNTKPLAKKTSKTAAKA